MFLIIRNQIIRYQNIPWKCSECVFGNLRFVGFWGPLTAPRPPRRNCIGPFSRCISLTNLPGGHGHPKSYSLVTPLDITMCSPGMEDEVEVSLWGPQTQLQMERLWCHETKRSERVFLWCDVEFLYENSDVLKNKQVSTFQSENSISVKSRSREIFCQKCDLIHLLSLTQIDLDFGPTIKGMMFHHRPITQCFTTSAD